MVDTKFSCLIHFIVYRTVNKQIPINDVVLFMHSMHHPKTFTEGRISGTRLTYG